MTFVRISGRFESEISVLTGSDNLGNYNTHAIARISVESGDGYRLYEVPVLTGNSLKHWHSVYLAQAYQSLGGTLLNELCREGIGLRGYTVESTLSDLKEASSETEAIKDLCNDIHGFLIVKKGEKQIKRDSLVKVSFAAPVFDINVLEFVTRFSEIHNRIDPISTQKSNKQKSSDSDNENTAQMVFKQEYSSSPLYGFNISMNLNYVCKPMYETASNVKVCSDEEIKLRKKASVLALSYLFTGVGAKQSRALGISRPVELLAAVSDSPIPNLIHGSYVDYMEKSIDIMKLFNNVKILCYGVNCKKLEKTGIEQTDSSIKQTNLLIEQTNSLSEFFNKLLQLVSGESGSNNS